MSTISKIFCSVKNFSILIGIFFSIFIFSLNASAARLESFDNYFKGSSLGPVQKKESAHFVVSWVNPKDELIADSLLQHLEAAHQELNPIFKDSSETRAKVPVEIFPDLKSFSDVSKLSMARFKATGTIALTLDQRLMILSPRNLVTGYNWAVTVVHEYVHYLIREISMDHIPIWLHEGVAQIFQGYPYQKEMKLSPSQWGLFKKSKEKNKLLDLDTLKEPFPTRKTPEEAELAYIEALLFADWLNKKCGVLKVIHSAGRLKSVEKALSECTGWSNEVLKKKFMQEILANVTIPAGKDVEFFARDFSGGDPLEVEGKKADKKSRDFAQLSTELFKQGRYRSSATELEKAFKESPVHPPSWQRQLASAYEKVGEKKKSASILDQVVRDYPDDAAAWYLIAQQQYKNGEQKPAWISFVKAFFINPFLDGLAEEMRTLREKNPSFNYSFF
ncbi:MAG: tetratricopeptide repeat protein [Deltaproteobacteria bacterium]|nr:tetratricopeptide repeat protein [Deltaproteobacteria bacterium]